MEKLEIGLGHIKQLIDDDVDLVVEQCLRWDDLEDCEALYDLDISEVPQPLQILPDLLMSKADAKLNEAQAEGFKSAWQELHPQQQLIMVLRVKSSA